MLMTKNLAIKPYSDLYKGLEQGEKSGKIQMPVCCRRFDVEEECVSIVITVL